LFVFEKLERKTLCCEKWSKRNYCGNVKHTSNI